MNYRRSIVLVSLLLALVMVFPVFAQDDSIASGLLNPRNMAFDTDGNLYVAESGVAGGLMSADDTEFGATSRIIKITPEGQISVVTQGLISYRGGNTLGANAVQVTEGSIWFLLGETTDLTVPFTHALVELDMETGRVKNFVDLLTLELEDDPDGDPNGQSNPVDFAIADDGTIFIANAGCNCLMSWNAMDGLQVAVVWSFADDNPVPTSVEIGPDGDIYVGFLTGFPFPEGSSRVERWSGGELVETYAGLTAVTGLLVTHDGTIYAVEHGVFNQGWEPGRVVEVTADGPVAVLEDLQSPYGLAQAPDGTIVVSVGSTGGADGAILVVPSMME